MTSTEDASVTRGNNLDPPDSSNIEKPIETSKPQSESTTNNTDQSTVRRRVTDPVGIASQLPNSTSDGASLSRTEIPAPPPVASNSSGVSATANNQRNIPPAFNGNPPPRQQYRGNRHEVNNNYNYQYELRFFLVLLAVAVIGLMYVQVENNSLLKRQQLVPRSVGHVYRKVEPRSPEVHDTSTADESSSAIESDLDDVSTLGDIHHPEIHPDYQLHAKYLSTVLKNLGDMIRKFETGNNITRPLGGIIELSTKIQDEEDDQPEYMKKLSSLIDELKSVKKNVKQKSAQRYQEEERLQRSEAEARRKERLERKRRIENEWEKLFDDLLDIAAEEEREEGTDEEKFVRSFNTAVQNRQIQNDKENTRNAEEDNVFTNWFSKNRREPSYAKDQEDQARWTMPNRQVRGDQDPTTQQDLEDDEDEDDITETLTRQGSVISEDEELETVVALHKRMIQARKDAKIAQERLEAIIKSSSSQQPNGDKQEDGPMKNPQEAHSKKHREPSKLENERFAL